MQKLKLNKDFGKIVKAHGFELDATKKYVIDLRNELDQQISIMQAVQIMGLPAMKDYHTWLKNNGFDVNTPDPTNDFVSKFYGVKPLWKTDISQGIVVKEEADDDYYIVMECSRLNEGFKYTQIVVTLGGCV